VRPDQPNIIIGLFVSSVRNNSLEHVDIDKFLESLILLLAPATKLYTRCRFRRRP
jgi:hypothetical protein